MDYSYYISGQNQHHHLAFNVTRTQSEKYNALFITLRPCWTVPRCETIPGYSTVLNILYRDIRGYCGRIPLLISGPILLYSDQVELNMHHLYFSKWTIQTWTVPASHNTPTYILQFNYVNQYFLYRRATLHDLIYLCKYEISDIIVQNIIYLLSLNLSGLNSNNNGNN